MVEGRCETAGCGRFVRVGARRCRRHAIGEDGSEERGEEAPGALAEEFRRRLAGGDYRALYGEALEAVLAQAAAGRDLADEIGALRVALARLLVEERDPTRLATAVARVAGVAVQAARTRRALGAEGGAADGAALTAMLSDLLGELDEA